MQTSLLLSLWSCINLIGDIMLPSLLLENLSLSVLCRIIWVQEEYGNCCPKQTNYQIVLQKKGLFGSADSRSVAIMSYVQVPPSSAKAYSFM